MSSSETYLIVGASLAGAKAAEALRDKGFEGHIVLIGSEQHLPYERPPLSKGYLAGSAERGKVWVHPEGWYAEHGIELRLNQTVSRIDRDARRVELADGAQLGYDKLLLTTGASPRMLSVPGADADGVYLLRTLDDSDALRELLARISRLVVIGAGWIGLEVSAAARQAGVEVTVVESAELPLLRVLGPEVARVFADLHIQHGVDFRFNASLSEICTDNGRATGVRLGDGTVIEADAVLVAVGVKPNSDLAEAAGLSVDDGIVVDSSLGTSDARIFAAGDVANAMNALYNKHVRVEHWANALNQPVTVAASMLDQPANHDQLPYFFTDQYDLGMEYVGLVDPGGYDQVVFRGDVASREFIAFWVRGGHVLAGMNVNVWDVVDDIKGLIRSQAVISAEQLADAGTPLAELARVPS
ncbi:MAG TPA: FAD-dependent oxidoreductase [Jatrophihabitans sp.]|jgi:3-phenylpropionate/trans-cinnamate dioxygenase ferredoxin reductase subunit|uniref:NAD(P)/FAD-dependent oxidoreductase n=1 Tax=Jatrophihabitans sp. TaxID=1932789 RepID=UPI002EE23487